MRGVFGWDYPPGCSGPPEEDEICEVCGKDPDNCICPQCPVCGEVGCRSCYDNHGLVISQEQIDSYEEASRKQESLYDGFPLTPEERFSSEEKEYECWEYEEDPDVSCKDYFGDRF